MNALEMALEALTNPSTIAVQHAIETIRQALAQPEQVPVAWMVLTQDDKKLMLWGQEKPPIFDAPVKLIPLYTAPPKREWVGLTDDEIEHLRNDQPWWMVRDIEAKLKEKNGG